LANTNDILFLSSSGVNFLHTQQSSDSSISDSPNCSSKIISGQAITESPVQQKLVNHFSKGSSSSKGKSAKKSVKRVNKKTQNKSAKSKKVQTINVITFISNTRLKNFSWQHTKTANYISINGINA
jgi:hypothetical protein